MLAHYIGPFKLLFWAPIVFAITYNIPKFFEMAACDVSEVTSENLTASYIGISNSTVINDDMSQEIGNFNSTDVSLLNYSNATS